MNQTNRRMVTIAMMVAVFLTAIDVTVVSTAMPHIVGELQGLSLYSWVFAIYTLTTCVTTPIYGKLADLFGRKIIFIVGVILFVLGSVLSGMAQSMEQLIWFRAFQGIGAGAVMPVTFTIIGDIYPGEQRAKMQGLFSGVWGIAGLLGPLVGGMFVDHFSWRWIFYINVPVGAISLILVLKFLHETVERKSKKIDYWGALVFTAAITALLYALLNGGTAHAWNSPTILLLLVGSLMGIILFLWIETKVEEPMLPLSIFKIRVISISNILGFLLSFVLIGANVYLPMWIQTILHHSATSSGLTLMPMSIAWPLASTFAGRYMYRIGSKRTTLIGVLLVSLATTWTLAIQLDSPYWYFIGLMIVLGFGMGYAITPTTVLIQSAVSWEMRGAATASNSFVRSLGQTIGITVLGSMFNASVARYAREHNHSTIEVEALAHALHQIFIMIFIVAIIALIVAIFLPSHQKILEQQKNVE
ncbi:MDR family MFS transporter [Paucisalibacillus globulus]|uniref:MDR family MFS transporter n=1 Tax=Paucisalibacillus globulus TaxID=351095 RepID=UPI000478E903|nr:MDR family MFS transporter [Paucisalibacillus globulus]